MTPGVVPGPRSLEQERRVSHVLAFLGVVPVDGNASNATCVDRVGRQASF
jgi:hypothetical protein